VVASAAERPPEPAAYAPVLRQYQAENVADIVRVATSGVGRVGVATFVEASPARAGAAGGRRRGRAAGAASPGRACFAAPARLLYVLPTGGGKTVVLAAVVAQLARKGLRTLVLVHREELLQQTHAQLRRCGVEAGLIAPRAKHAPKALAQVASVQTLRRRLQNVRARALTLPRLPPAAADCTPGAAQDYGTFELIIIDEAHHALADSYLSILAKHPNAAVVGATATPYRMDGQGLAPLFTSLLRGPTVRWLIDSAFLASLRVMRAAAQIDTRNLSLEAAGDYSEKPLAKRAMAINGEVVVEFQRNAGSRRALVYAVNLEHSRQLAAQFVAAGFAAEHIDGSTPRAERAAIMARMRSGETQILVNFEIVTEGFDVPQVEAIVLARPTMSPVLHFQMLGRGLRIAPGKVRD
jgi:superfamily II DNA or RNA helicase